jgi:hypothetical protein
MGSRRKSKSNKSSADVGKSFAANKAANPERPFSELQNNFNSFRDGEIGSLLGMFMPMIGSGMEAMGSNPMFEKMGFSNPFEGIFDNLQSSMNSSQEAQPQQPQLSPYEQQLQFLMDRHGMTRQQAMANQAHAMRLGTDYNRDGAVTNDEWKKYQGSGMNNTPAPMHYGSMGGGGTPNFGQWSYGNLRQR